MEYKYICEKCNFKNNYMSHWIKHIETEFHKTGKKKIRSDKKNALNCTKCEYTCKSNILMIQHRLNTHSTLEERMNEFKYYCKLCDYGTFSKDFIEKHNNTKKHKHNQYINNLL